MSLDLKKIQALCFDVDGTLRDTDDQYVLRFEKMLRPMRALLPKFDPHRTARLIIMKIEGPANFVYSIPDLLTVDDEIADFGEWLIKIGIRKEKKHHDFIIIPGIPKMLKKLDGQYPMCVISARGRRGTVDFLKSSELESYFQFAVTGQTAHRTKPHPAPVLWAAEKMGIPPENCLMIGDTTVDIKAGKRAGAQTVGVLSGFGEKEELVRAGADLILDSAADLPEILFADK